MLETYERALQNPLRASVMYPPDRRLFRPFAQPTTHAAIEALLQNAAPRMGLYAHIPFCEPKCTYCDYETVPLQGANIDAYVEALCRELTLTLRALPRTTEITGFDIGGGTPGVLSVKQFERIIKTLEGARLASDFEISTETTPTMAAADPRKWSALKQVGIGRISMGVQSDENALLTQLNRGMHDSDHIGRGMDALRAFDLINLDLMFALPGLTAERFAKTVARAVSLAPDVITVYDTVYKNRGIATQARRIPALAPSRQDYGAQYDLAFAALNAAGYRGRYGSVNFSRKAGRLGTSRYLESRILDGTDYVGVGLYASSLQGATWRFGKRSYRAWMAQTELGAEDLYALPAEHVMAKYILLALSYGYIDSERFERRFQEPLSRRFARVLDFLLTQKLLRESDDGFEMVPGTFSDLPGARALFYPEDALPWLGVNVL